jgi:hypothetical protein
VTPLTVCVAVILSPLCNGCASGTAKKPTFGTAGPPIKVDPFRKILSVALGTNEST